MAGDSRQRMIESATLLLAKRGPSGASFSEVLEASGAPRGSIYHHFPEGKDQLVAAAVELAGDRAIALLDGLTGESAVTVTERFLAMWRSALERSQFRVGCAVLAVTVETDSPELLDRTAAVFRAWRGRLAELLEQGGVGRDQAASAAAMLVASSEGAVALARAERSLAPFDLVAGMLVEQIEGLSG
jgi:TetR/AcrR family transcriptional repressor of lmrAB and yxaGH operons